MTGFLQGCATALITPFTQSGVNFCVLEALIERQIEAGVSALVVLGTTGEPATMSEGERYKTVRFAKSCIRDRAKLLVGVGHNCTTEAVRAAGKMYELGADGLLAVTPYYNKCTQRGIVEYYRALAGASPLPVVAYNVPSRTGVNILPSTMREISEIEGVVGLKDACGNMQQTLETAFLLGGKCELYSGEDALNLPILCAGGSAVISVVSNVAPRTVCALVSAVERGDLAEARRLQNALHPLTKACFAEVNPIPVKAALSLMGYDVGIPRPPLTPLSEEHLPALRAALAGGLQ